MENLSVDEKKWRLLVEEASVGKRLDAYVAQVLTQYSRNRIKELILSGAVAINGETIIEPRRKVKLDDDIILVAPPPEDPEPQGEDIPLDILFEDDHLIVINKPAGLVVHPAPGNYSGTLVNALIFHCGDTLKGIGGVKRPGIVHRLDKDTSGVMVAAKTDRALNHLAAQFADHGRTGPLERAYTAFAWGSLQMRGGTVNAPLGRDPYNRFKQSVRKKGREAITHYAIKARFMGEGWEISQMECRLETGRTHQIRVHMAHISHPLISDQLYGSGYATKANRLPEPLRTAAQTLGRQALHARLLGFEHPRTGEHLSFEAPLPPELLELQKALSPYNKAKANPNNL